MVASRALGGVSFQVLADFPAVRQLQVDIIAVDIPIGLTAIGIRSADRLASQVLVGPRASSFFSAPLRAMLAATEWREACRIRAALEGKKVTKQAWGIVKK